MALGSLGSKDETKHLQPSSEKQATEAKERSSVAALQSKMVEGDET